MRTLTDIAPTELQEEINLAVRTAQDMQVKDQPSLVYAADFLKACAMRIKVIKDTFDPIVSKAHEAHKQATTTRKVHLDPVEEAKVVVSRKIGIYESQQATIRMEAENKAIREAQARQDAEKLAEAEALQASGMSAEAEAVLNEDRPLEIVKAPGAPKIDGLSFRETWKFEVLDVSKLPPEYLLPNEVAIGQVVRALKENATKSIPGIRVWSEKTTITKTA